jgi:hypothetical protein
MNIVALASLHILLASLQVTLLVLSYVLSPRPPPPPPPPKTGQVFTVHSARRVIIVVYIEYNNFCSVVGIGSPHPLPRKRVSILVPGGKGGGATLAFG